MPYIQKHKDAVYLDINPFSGDRDVDISHYKCKLVTTRKEHVCCGNYLKTQHNIPSGTKVFFEKAFLDGPVSSYFCLKCYDKYLEDNEVL